jgi:phosphopantothenoylcysteine synthetase/decarboxylase
MNLDMITGDKQISTQEEFNVCISSLIEELNTASKTSPVKCTLIERTCEGVYTREFHMPKNAAIVGRVHKEEHLNVLAQGRVQVVTKDGTKELVAPCQFISNKHTQRALKVLEDAVWITIHRAPTTDDPIEEFTVKEFKDLNLKIEVEDS